MPPTLSAASSSPPTTASSRSTARRRRPARPAAAAGGSRTPPATTPRWSVRSGWSRWPSPGPSGGALILTAAATTLTATRDTLEVLAGQAALALDRICLVEAVGRRDSDLYLRAVIRNSADIMLVIDEDQRIRYASPSLRELLGAGRPSAAGHTRRSGAPGRPRPAAPGLPQLRARRVFCSLLRADGSQVLVEATYRDLRADRWSRVRSDDARRHRRMSPTSSYPTATTWTSYRPG